MAAKNCSAAGDSERPIASMILTCRTSVGSSITSVHKPAASVDAAAAAENAITATYLLAADRDVLIAQAKASDVLCVNFDSVNKKCLDP